MNSERKRRVFRWPKEARELVRNYQDQVERTGKHSRVEREILIAKLIQVTQHPRDACLRLLRHLRIVEKRAYRAWTKPEQQRLLDLIAAIPVEEAAKLMRRPPGSVRSMLHRLEAGGRKGREWFTKSSLASALHIHPAQVQSWMDHGWLKSRIIETQGLKMQIIAPEEFCDFFKRHGSRVVGRRLGYEGLLFVRNYVFPPSHADLLAVRGTYKKQSEGATPVRQAVASAPKEPEENVQDESA